MTSAITSETTIMLSDHKHLIQHPTGVRFDWIDIGKPLALKATRRLARCPKRK